MKTPATAFAGVWVLQPARSCVPPLMHSDTPPISSSSAGPSTIVNSEFRTIDSEGRGRPGPMARCTGGEFG
jgi:hypothetical protein